MRSKTMVTSYYIASVLFYIVAIINFSDTGFSSGVIWLCLGSAFLCLGGVLRVKIKSLMIKILPIRSDLLNG